MTNAMLAERIVNKILRNLHGRKGIGNELDMIDADIYNDMEMDLRDTVYKVLDGQTEQ